MNNGFKKAITVRGEIESGKLGITLTHEHLLIDQSVWVDREVEEVSLKEKHKSNVSIKNLGDLVYDGFSYRDNLVISDVDTAIQEAKEFRNEGGVTIVDVTNIGLGRDPKALYKISLETGLNIIMGSGNYVIGSWSEKDKKRSAQNIAEDIIKDFSEDTELIKIKPGIIGEIGLCDIENPVEIKSLRGAAKAQKKIGCALTIHTPIWEKVGNKILDIVEDEEVDLRKVILSHCDPKMYDFKYIDSLAKRGVYIEFDEFGWCLRTPKSDRSKMIPSDNERVENIVKHINAGNLNNILLSHDVCTKMQLKNFGGFGYAHLLQHITPWLLDLGVTIEQLRTMLIENPKNVLCF